MATEEFGDVEAPSVEIKLFGKWSADEVHVNDISLAVSIHSCKSIYLQNGHHRKSPQDQLLDHLNTYTHKWLDVTIFSIC